MTTAAYAPIPTPVALRAADADPAGDPRDTADVAASDFDALLVRTAARMRRAHEEADPTPFGGAAFDAAALDVVLDAIGFAQRWTR